MRRFCTVIVLTVLVVILGIHTVSFGEMPRSIPVLTDSVMLSEYLADCTQFLSENENKMTAVAFEIMEFAQQNSESFFSIYEEGISVLNSDEIIFAEPEDSNLYPKLCKLFFTKA